MNTTKIKFSPSINIQRDSRYLFDYIATPNATSVFNTILSGALSGIKSNVIIGAYGTGKSSWLLAFQQTLCGVKKHFKGFDVQLKRLTNYEFVTIVGSYSSLAEYFANLLKLSIKDYSSNDLIKALDAYYKQLEKQGKGIAILIDEFGKFLEYASKHNPESELYFIQQLAEWINDSNKKTLLIATLHQGFNEYSIALNKRQKEEWNKVSGRLNELVFNEPVEQLLFLAAERLNEKFSNKAIDKTFIKLFTSIKLAKAFPLRDYFDEEIARKLYPFDILSAAVLTLALQKYGQNERSLFSFIEKGESYGIGTYNVNNGYYSIPQVYDYLLNNHYSFITSKNNPHYIVWTNIRSSLERIDGLLPEDIQKQAGAIVKTIGLLNIFASASSKFDPEFYLTFGKIALGLRDVEFVLEELKKYKIIRYVKHSFKYVLFEGTDLDIELAIDEAGRIVERATNVVDLLNQYFEFPFIPAKAHYYRTGTPRFFQFKLTDKPITLVPEGEIDGFINLVFGDADMEEKVKAHAESCEEAILYGYYRNTEVIQDTLHKIQKVKKVISSNSDDKVAVKALKEIEGHYVKLLNHYVLDSLYSNQGNITWYEMTGAPIITDRQSFNKALSSICDRVYKSTPRFRNELVNKTKVSSQIASARGNLIDKLLNDVGKENLDFDPDKFPPEKSIYLSLLKKTGIHSDNEGWGLNKPTDQSFQALWKAGNLFLESSKSKGKNLQEFIDILSAKPFKLKQGFIDFWIPIFLLAKNDEYALYEGDVYQPQLSDDILDLINKKPSLFKVKAFDVAGVRLELFNRYRIFLNQSENHKPTNKLFIQTIKPFLVFYRELPEYTKKTTLGLSKQAIALRDAIASAKDPEKLFFEELPAALRFNIAELQTNEDLLEAFIIKLQLSIKQLREAYDELLDGFEKYFISDILELNSRYPDYKRLIKERYKNIKAHLLLNHQKAFYNRLFSELEDRKAWLGSIAQSCIGKPLNQISDHEKRVLYEKIKDLVYELDNLCEISKQDIDEEKEEVLMVQVTSFVQGLNKDLIRISKGRSKEIDVKVKELRNRLGKDKKTNITILAKLLQELLK